MQVRRRTRRGKNINQNIEKTLSLVAKSKDDITLEFIVKYCETQFLLILPNKEAIALAEKIIKEVGND